MRSLRSLLLSAAIVLAAGTFWACNDNLDDPTLSEGLLTIESVNPAIVAGDRVADIDPNSGLPINPPTNSDDEVTITIKNRPRVSSTGGLADVFLKRATRSCVNQNGTTVAASVTPLATTLTAGASTSFTIVAATTSEKVNNAVDGDSWTCAVQFSGEDLAGNPAKSQPASYTVSIFD